MPNGKIRIKTTEAGERQVWLERDGSDDIHLEGISDAGQFQDGLNCQYQKAGKQLIITIGNRNITWSKPKKKQQLKQKKKVRLSAEQALRQTQKENPAMDIPEPELTLVSDCPERKKLSGKNLFDLNRQALRLPEDTINTLQKLKHNDKVSIDNFGLALNKAVHFYKHKGVQKPTLYKVEKSQHFEIDFSFDSPTSKATLNTLNHRQERLLNERKNHGWDTHKPCFTIQNRLIAGLGGTSVFETSMTLHHIYSIPYLPGSSIKGLIRSWIIMNCFLPDKQDTKEGERGKAAEKAAMKNTLFAHIFGTDTNGPEKKAHQGKVVFYDAYPQTPPVIEADVMNVHYPKYYSKGEVPADYDSPNPIPFLTVGKCDVNNQPLKFCFALAARENIKGVKIKDVEQSHVDKLCKNKEGQWHGGLNENSTVLEVVNYWLHSALTHHGIGAKTAVGYGYFKNP